MALEPGHVYEWWTAGDRNVQHCAEVVAVVTQRDANGVAFAWTWQRTKESA